MTLIHKLNSRLWLLIAPEGIEIFIFAVLR